MTPTPQSGTLSAILNLEFKEKAMRKLIALFLIVALVFPLTLATLSVISISSWVLDRNFYTNLVSDSRLYEALLTEDLPGYFNSHHIVQQADSLPAGALSKALREMVTPDYLRDQSVRLVNNAFDFIEGRTFTLDLYFDAAPIKAALQSDGGPRFAHTLAANLPGCAASQESIAPGGSLMRCLPSDVTVDQAANKITAALPAFLNDVPDHINLNREPINMNVRWRGVSWSFIGATGGLNIAIGVLLFMAAGAWLITAFIGGEDRRGHLLWLGWSLIFPAIIIFLIGLAVTTPLAFNWTNFGLSQAHFGGAEFSPAFREAIVSVAGSALNTIANGFLAAGAVAGALALMLMTWGLSTELERPLPPLVNRGSVNQDSGNQSTVQGTANQGSGVS